MKKYKKVAVGGTFDRLHKGHEELLRKAFAISETVVIGVTTEDMTINKELSLIIEPYFERKKHLELFLKKKGFFKRASIISLSDQYGTSLSDNDVQAVVAGPRVSLEAIDEINKRKDVVICKTITSKDGSDLSSSRIRSGQIDRSGTVHSVPDSDLHLPVTLRKNLRSPLGEYVTNQKMLVKNPVPLLISVGDASFISLRTEEIYPDLIIVDGMIQRKHIYTEQQIKKLLGNKYEFVRTVSFAATLSKNTMDVIKSSMELILKNKSKRALFVRSEDDLSVLACIYYAPLSSVVVYGQPAFPELKIKSGMIAVTVTEKKKAQVARLLKRFNLKH